MIGDYTNECQTLLAEPTELNIEYVNFLNYLPFSLSRFCEFRMQSVLNHLSNELLSLCFLFFASFSFTIHPSLLILTIVWINEFHPCNDFGSVFHLFFALFFLFSPGKSNHYEW